MKEQGDIIRGWVRKARSDEVAFEAALKAGAFDAACFHAQQAVEKYLKAFLFQRGKEFRFTHNLAKLVEICAVDEPSFRTLTDVVAPLTPYAVELRYDADFGPRMRLQRKPDWLCPRCVIL